MAGTKVVIAQADYQHLLSTVKLLAGATQETEETVGFVFSLLAELGIVVEALPYDSIEEGVGVINSALLTDLLNGGPAVWETKQIWSNAADEPTDTPPKPIDYASVLSSVLPNHYRPAEPSITDVGNPTTTTFTLEPAVSTNDRITVCSDELTKLYALTYNGSLLCPITPKEIEGNGQELLDGINALTDYLVANRATIIDRGMDQKKQTETKAPTIQEKTDRLNRLLAACPKATINGIDTVSTRCLIDLDSVAQNLGGFFRHQGIETEIAPSEINSSDIVFEDPSIDLESVLLIINSQSNVNRLVFHPDTPYKLINAVKAHTKLECAMNDTIVGQPSNSPNDFEDLLRSDVYVLYSDKRLLLIVDKLGMTEIAWLLSHFRKQIDNCVLTEALTAEDLSVLQFHFAEVKICCLNGIK